MASLSHGSRARSRQCQIGLRAATVYSVPAAVKEAYARLIGHGYRRVKTDLASNFQNVAQQKYGDTSAIPTTSFFYGLQSGQEIAVEIERGKTLIVRYLTTGEVREDGTRTVFYELN